MKPKGNPDRVIVSAEEAQREKVAQRLASQGASAFGDPNERFDIDGDKAAMDGVGMALAPDTEKLAANRNMELEAIATAGFGGGHPSTKPQDLGVNKMVTNKQDTTEEQSFVSNAEVTQAKVEEASKDAPEDSAKKELSSDPVERMHQVSGIYRETNPNFPSGDQLVNLKNMVGEIFILDLDDRVFIYRYLKRQEWVQMNANEAYHGMRQDQKEDMIYNKCVLWPKFGPEQVASLPAGCISSIVGQIEQQSMFIDPIQLANRTIKL